MWLRALRTKRPEPPAGDVVTGLNQIAVAQGEIAATAVHNEARRAEGKSLG